jgi:hypothetical protein
LATSLKGRQLSGRHQLSVYGLATASLSEPNQLDWHRPTSCWCEALL